MSRPNDTARARLPAPVRHFGVIALAAALFFLPQLLGASPVIYGTCVVIAIFAVMAYGVDVVLSYLGEVSLGHTVFWAVGGYVTAILATRYGANGWVTAGATVVSSLVAAFLLGAATLRTREFVFSLVTYAAAVVCMEIAFNWDAVGGSDGIIGIPLLDLPFYFWRFKGQSSADLWPIAFALLTFAILFIDRFRRSRLGTAALMVQMNPALATSLGLDIRRVRLGVFVASAPITGLAGWLYAYQRAYVGPDMFETYFLVIMLTAVVLVGRRLLLGPLIGTAIIQVQQNLLSVGGDGNKVILGLLLAAILILWPKGLVGLIRLLTPGLARRPVAPET
jgi:branched-chain amino acid transport system permease protein